MLRANWGRMDMTETPQVIAADTVEPPPGPLAGMIILLIVVALIVSWIVIGTALFSLVSFFASFLLLWFWANNEKLDIKRLPSATLGALYGIGLAYAMHELPARMGGAGMALALGLVLLSLYVQICNWVPLVVNASAMLFLTVAAAPLIMDKVDWLEIALATLLGAVYIGGFVEGMKWIAGKIAPPGAS